MVLLSLSSCWSEGGTTLSRTTPRTSCSCLITRTTRRTASARFIKLNWTPPHERSCLGMVLERASPHSLSGWWCPANRNSRGPRGWWHQPHSGPRAQSTSTPGRIAARAQCRRRARACRGCWAIAIRSDRADDHPRARAPSVWPGARADSKSEDGYSCGDRGGNGKPRLRCHHWWWAHTGLWTVNWLGYGNTLHSTFIRTVELARYPTQPPSPTASHRPVPFLNAIFAGFRQSLCSPSAHHLWRGLAVGLPISSSVGIESGGSLDSAFSLRGPDSASVLRPSGSTMASSSLISTGARQSTRLPRPSGSALVSHLPTSTSGLHSSGYASSLRPSGSIRLILPPQLHLCRSAAAFRSSVYLGREASVSAAESAATSPPWLLPASAPPWATIVTVAWVLPGSSCSKSLLPISVLAPPSISTLDSVSRPPPGCLSSAWTSSSIVCLLASPSPSPVTIPHPLLFPPPKSPTIPPFVPRREATPSERGANCHNPLDSCFAFCLCSLPVCPYLVLFLFSVVHCLIISESPSLCPPVGPSAPRYLPYISSCPLSSSLSVIANVTLCVLDFFIFESAQRLWQSVRTWSFCSLNFTAYLFTNKAQFDAGFSDWN